MRLFPDEDEFTAASLDIPDRMLPPFQTVLPGAPLRFAGKDFLAGTGLGLSILHLESRAIGESIPTTREGNSRQQVAWIGINLHRTLVCR